MPPNVQASAAFFSISIAPTSEFPRIPPTCPLSMSFTAATAGEGGSRRTRPPARGPAWPRRRDARFGVLAPAGRAGAHPLRPHRRAERALRGGGRLGQRRARRVSLGRRGGGGGDARGFPLDVLARRARRRRGRGVVPARKGTPELRRVGTRRDARRAPRGAGTRDTSVRARGTRRRRRDRRDERAFSFLSALATTRVGERRPREVRGEGGGCRLDERRNGVRLGGGGR